MIRRDDEKAVLVEYLRELHLPTVRSSFEEAARRAEMEVLFTLLAERYERGSVTITSNLPFSKWEAIFKDPMTTAAAIDRLVHHSVILELNIPSYRMEHRREWPSRACRPTTPPPLDQSDTECH
jgi:DNA replication protein DnaC